ncbi:MAG: pyrroline-5-carboxylate reductase family protein, partial [Phycisphaerae bacterium]
MKLGFVGGGNMATALVHGVLRAGAVRAADIVVSEPDAGRAAALGALGIRTVWDNTGVAREAEVLILAVKPQLMDSVLNETRAGLDPRRTLVASLAAGKRTSDIEARLPADARVVRVMPNTAIMVGAGMSALCRGRGASDADIAAVRVLFDCCGETVLLDERLLDAVTAVSGSGPAYFYLFTEALTEAG